MSVHARTMSMALLLTAVLPWTAALDGTKIEAGTDTNLIGNSPYGYLAYLPPGYATATSTTWPLWIFLEGLGEGGDGTVASMLSPNNGIVRHGPMRELWRPWEGNHYEASSPHDYPMIVVSPQAGVGTNNQGIFDINRLDQFITTMLATYRINPDRVVLTGMSTGGGGANLYAHYQAANAKRLAGCMPLVATTNYPGDATGLALAANLALTQIWQITAFDDTGGGGTVNTAFAWSNAVAQRLSAPVSPTRVELTYPYAPGGLFASPEHQNASFSSVTDTWTWTQAAAGTADNRRLDGALPTNDAARLMLGMYRNGGHGIWQDAINNSQVLNWIISRQRQQPFLGTRALVPGSIQAENFDRGGPGTGFGELTAGNQGDSLYRARLLPQWSRLAPDFQLQYQDALVDDPVEVSALYGAVATELSAGEWLAYSVDIALSSTYSMVLPVMSASGAMAHIELGGVNVSGAIAIPATANAFQSIAVPSLTLPGGRQVMTLVVDSGRAWFDRIEFSALLPHVRMIIDNPATVDVPGMWPVNATNDRFIGTGWSDLSAIAGSYGGNCLAASGLATNATAAYLPHLLYTADYAVELWYPAIGGNASAAVPVTITSALGTSAQVLDQRIGGGSWRPMGTFPFVRGLGAMVAIGGAADGQAYRYTLADAVRFTPLPTITGPATVSPLAGDGSQAIVSASAAFQGSGAGLTYTWSTLSAPPGGLATFSANGSQLARSTTVSVSHSGTYTFTVAVGFADDVAHPTVSSNVVATMAITAPPVPPFPTGSGSIVREFWTGIGGNTIADIPLATPPTGTDILTSLEGPTNWADIYGTRIRGTLTAPYSGAYVFWLATNNDGELWLSTSGLAADKVKIASISGWAGPRQWNALSSQKSAPVMLTAGTKYYIEVLQKEGAGNDNLAVGWSKPGETTTTASEVVPGTALSPYVEPPVVVPPVPTATGSGSIVREYWTGIAGNAVSAIPVSTPPSGTDVLTSLEGPTNWGDVYGVRIRGTITAPLSGSYTFWLATNNEGELWLSSTSTPDNKVKIAVVAGWAGPRQWDVTASQKSAPIALVAGQQYYVEVLQKEGAGTDNLAVGWSKPGEPTTVPSEVVPGSALSPYVPSAPVLPPALGTGSIAWEYWSGVAGNAVSDIPLAAAPSGSATLSSLEGPTNWADIYGVRVRGYLTAPYTGTYTFWLATNNDGELWLSSSESPASRVKIASVTGWAAPRQWDAYPTQKSVSQNLTRGVRYYIEVLHKEGAGNDNMAVGWSKPGEATTAPSQVIPGSALSPLDAAPLMPGGGG